MQALASLRADDEDAARTFAQAWGLMSYAAEANARLVPQDDLMWLWGHASTIRLLIDLGALLRDGTPTEMSGYLRSLSGRQVVVRNGNEERLPMVLVRAGGEARELRFESTEYAGIAREIISAVLSAQVSDLHFVVVGDGAVLAPALTARTPISAVYWMVAEALSEDRLRRCEREDCKVGFVAMDNRQRFCGDQCAGLVRKRKQRSKPTGKRGHGKAR